MTELFQTPPPPPLSPHQSRTIEELKRFRYTSGLRDLLGSRTFSPAECDHILVEAAKTYPLKMSVRRELAAGITAAALLIGCATKTVTVPAPTDEIRAQAFLDALTALHNDASVPADCQRIAENAIVQAAPIATPAP